MREDIRTRVLEALRARSSKARFVHEVGATLDQSNVALADVERALAGLEADGAVVVRDHACADPHLAGTDLRIVALVEPGEGSAARLAALQAIDATWQQWLGEYLANHRCG